MKKIPAKNYVILFVILLATVASAFYVRTWYITNKEYYSRNSVVKDIVREINIDELSNYIVENPKFILYVSSGVNSEIKSFEGDLRKLIKKHDISEDVVYLNVHNVSTNYLYDSLKGFSGSDKIGKNIIDSNSSLYIFIDGKIVGVLNNLSTFSNKHIESYLKKWGFIND